MMEAELYLWLKAFHIISVIAWMAGLLYLPRLYVYHADATPGSEASETFKVMERRLLRVIMTPAMVATLISGGLILVMTGVTDWETFWPWLKAVMVAGLLFMHDRLARWRRDFAADRNARPARFYRTVNEIPTLFMIVIVVMAVVEPF